MEESRISNKTLELPIFKFDVLQSTQTKARELYDKEGLDLFVVWAVEQAAGRGRRERSWHSPKGGLYFSLFSKKLGNLPSPQLISLAAGVAIKDVMEKLYDIACELKWPNDILYQGKKLCGILSEVASCGQEIDHAIVGIGINANTDLSGLPEGISREAIAVKNILNHEVDLEVLLATACTEVLDRISRLATQEGRSKTIADYKRHCLTLNSQVIVYLDKGKVSGRAFDITGEGALLVATPKETLTLTTGDVIHLRRR